MTFLKKKIKPMLSSLLRRRSIGREGGFKILLLTWGRSRGGDGTTIRDEGWKKKSGKKGGGVKSSRLPKEGGTKGKQH